MLIPRDIIIKIVKGDGDLTISYSSLELHFITTKQTETYVVSMPVGEGVKLNGTVDQNTAIAIMKDLEEVNMEQRKSSFEIFDDNKSFTLAFKEKPIFIDKPITTKVYSARDIPVAHLMSTVASDDIFGSGSTKQGIMLDSDYICSTNGISLTIVKSNIDIETTVIIPQSIFKRLDKQTKIAIDDDFIHLVKDKFHGYGTFLIGEFPRVQELLDKTGYVKKITINVEDLISLLDSSIIATSDDDKTAKFSVANDLLTLSINNPSINFEAGIDVTSTSTFECLLDVEVLKKVVKPFKDDTINIYFADDTIPIKIEGDNLIKFVALISPGQ